MESSPSTTKLLAVACGGALAAFACGLFFGCAARPPHSGVCFSATLLSGAILIFVLLRIRRTVKRLATNDTARKSAGQFLASCVFFSLLSSPFGMFVSGLIWYSRDFIRMFGSVWFGLLTCFAIYPVRRDAKRLTAAISSVTSGPS